MKRCSDVMTPDPRCCQVEDSVSFAAKLMKEENVGSIPVLQNNGSRKLVGIITDRDIVVHVIANDQQPADMSVADAMSRDLIVCRQDDPADRAAEAMASHQVRRIPVVDDNNNLVGIISQADIALRLNKPVVTGEVVAEISE